MYCTFLVENYFSCTTYIVTYNVSCFLVQISLLHTIALYHPTVLGTHTTLGQSEVWYSSHSLAKRPRVESAGNLPVYPQRPGEKDCAHYMQTRTCKFGDTCKFDHPIWVPEGGIPDWKEVIAIFTILYVCDNISHYTMQINIII